MTLPKLIAYIIAYLQENGLNLIWTSFLALLVFAAGYILSKRIVAKIKKRIEDNDLDPNDIYAKRMANVIGSMIFILLMIFVLLAVFEVIGFDAAFIMGGLSLGIGFAMETTIGNMISGIMLITNKKVKLGDFVKFLGSLNIAGTIDEINIRYTVLKTFDKRRIIIPNSVVAATPIQTMKSEPLVRGEITFTVANNVLISQVRDIMVNIINQHKYVYQKEYTSVITSGFTTAGVTIKAFFYASPLNGKSAVIVGRDLTGKIYNEFKKYGIDLPYEHIVLTVE